MEQNRDVRLRLPSAVVRNLDRLARQRGVSRSRLLRRAVEDLLVGPDQETRDREMAAYVSEMAPYSGDVFES